MKTNNKFTILIQFKVLEGKEIEFINCWTELTNLIYRFAGSNGSRLHKADKQLYIAYAQWADQETWQNASDKLPETAIEFRKKMRECCSEINTEYEMNVIQDLIKDQTYHEAEK